MDTDKSNPRISVLIPSYNGEKFLVDTLNSVINQSYENWEAIVMDGGSTDNTLDILKAYTLKYPNIHVFSESDEGPYHAIHKATKEAKGDFFYVLAISDGYLDKNWFKDCMDIMNRDNEISLVWGIPMDAADDGRIIGPGYIYSHFLLREQENGYRESSIIKKLISKFAYGLKNPSQFIALFRKINMRNLSALGHMITPKKPPQKQEWFKYWLSTGTIFPDGNSCVSRQAFFECMPPYKMGTREPGDWMGFYFNFNTRGYLAYCIPKPANFSKTHGGQISEIFHNYNDKNRRDYFKKLKEFRKKIIIYPEMVKFISRDGNPIE